MEDLITKKELLDQTGISYGSLYRWKRKNLIPDEWFIHRATYTGHETFFPRDKIIRRIEKIQEMKETMSLDEIAEAFDPTLQKVEMTLSDLHEKDVASQAVIDLYLARYGEIDLVDRDRLLSIHLFATLLDMNNLSRDEVYEATDLFNSHAADLSQYRLVLCRKLGVCTMVLAPEEAFLHFDSNTAVITEISIQRLKAELKELLGEDGQNEQ